MPEWGRLGSDSKLPVNVFKHPLKETMRAIGNAFNRLVHPQKASKQLPQNQQKPILPDKQLQNRSTETARVQTQINEPSQPAKTQQTQPPPAVNGSAPGAALYTNRRYRDLVSQARVIQHFEQPKATSQALNKAAWSLYNQGANSLTGKNPALQAKGIELGQISKDITAHDQALNQPLAHGPEGIERQGRRVIDNLQNGINHLDHLMKQPGRKMTPNEQKYFNEILTALRHEQNLMLQVMDDPGASSLSESVDLRQAMELKRLGYDINQEIGKHFSSLSDKQLINGSEQKFGSGHIHSVTKLQFRTTSGVVEKVFKGEDPVDPCPFDAITGPENYLDKKKPRFAARNFAAAKFDDMLGSKLMPKMELVVHKGQLGVLMDVAKGVKPYEQDSRRFNWVPVEDKRQPQKAAVIQQQLNTAEWLDGICGQQDRHAGNLFIDRGSGNVTLIDNDMGFYPGQKQVRMPSKSPGFRRFSGSTAGKPAVIDVQVYKKLMAITARQIHQQMDGLLTKREILSTVSRVRELQAHAKKLASRGRVIDNWEQWRDRLTKRSAAELQSRIAPDCYLRSVQGKTRGL